jgi:hypothetical protein
VLQEPLVVQLLMLEEPLVLQLLVLEEHSAGGATVLCEEDVSPVA